MIRWVIVFIVCLLLFLMAGCDDTATETEDCMRTKYPTKMVDCKHYGDSFLFCNVRVLDDQNDH